MRCLLSATILLAALRLHAAQKHEQHAARDHQSHQRVRTTKETQRIFDAAAAASKRRPPVTSAQAKLMAKPVTAAPSMLMAPAAAPSKRPDGMNSKTIKQLLAAAASARAARARRAAAAASNHHKHVVVPFNYSAPQILDRSSAPSDDAPPAPPIAAGDRSAYDARIASLIARLRARAPEYGGLNDDSGLDRNLFHNAGITMQPEQQLRGLQTQLEHLVDAEIAGDIVETGTWRAGTAIFMVAVLDAYEQFKGARPRAERHFWYFDSFEGFRGTDTVNSALGSYLDRPVFAAPLGLVLDSFRRYRVLDERVHLIKGLFESSVPAFGAPPRPIALLRLDGDLYSSTRVVLRHFYPSVTSGGTVVIDDYGWHPKAAGGTAKLCRHAVDEYREEQGVTAKMDVVANLWTWTKP